MSAFTLIPNQTILLIIDMQEKVLPVVDRGAQILHMLLKAVKGFQILDLPILLSEQYPEGLGQTVFSLASLLDQSYHPWIKSTFSCLDDPAFFNYALSIPYQQWIVAGIEAHVCVLQTVKGLLKLGKQVVVLNDAIGSRSIDNFLTAIAEMRDEGARMSSVETILFELLKDSKHPHFKTMSNLIKASCSSCQS
ncbi:MAG: isochorismatase family protein [Parachlamydiaceae bacterium]